MKPLNELVKRDRRATRWAWAMKHVASIIAQYGLRPYSKRSPATSSGQHWIPSHARNDKHSMVMYGALR